MRDAVEPISILLCSRHYCNRPLAIQCWSYEVIHTPLRVAAHREVGVLHLDPLGEAARIVETREKRREEKRRGEVRQFFSHQVLVPVAQRSRIVTLYTGDFSLCTSDLVRGPFTGGIGSLYTLGCFLHTPCLICAPG